jgi:hypothetical protein
MAMGCIPITSRYTDSSLPHLIGFHDLGPAEALTPNLTDTERRLWFQTHWIPSLEAAYLRQQARSKEGSDGRYIEKHRAEMRTQVMANFTWRRIAEIFLHHSQERAPVGIAR